MILEPNEIQSIVDQLKKELLPIGSILIYPAETVPSGFLPCDGRELSKEAFSELYSIIKGTWGESDKSFFLPDLQGQFVRGWDKEGNVDPERQFGTTQKDAFQGHSHVINVKGKVSEEGGHNHSLYFFKNTIHYGTNTFSADNEALLVRNFESYDDYREHTTGTYSYAKDSYGSYSVAKAGMHTHDLPEITVLDPKSCANGVVSYKNETRPKNVAMVFCIKAK